MNQEVPSVIKITTQSKAFLQASNNLALENILLNEEIAKKALHVVNEGIELSPLMIKEVVKRG